LSSTRPYTVDDSVDYGSTFPSTSVQGTINDYSTGDDTSEEPATVETPVIGEVAGDDAYDATNEAIASHDVLAVLIAQIARGFREY